MGISKLVSGHTIPFHFRNRISARKCNLYIVLLLKQTSHESEPDSPHPIGGGGSLHMSQSYTTTPCYRPRSSSVPRFTYGSIPPRSESPFGTASSTCSRYAAAWRAMLVSTISVIGRRSVRRRRGPSSTRRSTRCAAISSGRWSGLP